MHTSSRFVVQNESIQVSFFHHMHCNLDCPLQCFPTRTTISCKCIIFVHATHMLIVVVIQYKFIFVFSFTIGSFGWMYCRNKGKKILSCKWTIKTFPSRQNVNSPRFRAKQIRANQWTGFYMITAFVMKRLIFMALLYRTHSCFIF